MKTKIQLPPIEIWKDEATKRWSWSAPNGARGTHEGSARGAAITALNSLRIAPDKVTLPSAESRSKD